MRLRFLISNDWRRHFVHDVVIGKHIFILVREKKIVAPAARTLIMCKQPFNDTIAMKGVATTTVMRPCDFVTVLVFHKTDCTTISSFCGTVFIIAIMLVPGRYRSLSRVDNNFLYEQEKSKG
jgi:hypothetical protein